MNRKIMIALGTAATVSFAPAAFANSAAAPAAETQAAPAMQAPAQANVSDDQLKEFVKVEQEVRTVSEGYQQKLSSVQDQAEMSAIAQEANTEMTAIVEKSPLSVEEYNQIAMAISADRNLQQRYQQHSGQ